MLGVQRVESDDASGEVQLVCHLAHRQDLAGLAANLELSQHQASAMLDGRDQQAAALGLLRGATDILPIHGDCRPSADSLQQPVSSSF